MVKEDLFTWTNPDDTALDLEAVEATVMALLKIVMTQDTTSVSGGADSIEKSRENRESRDLPAQQDEVLQQLGSAATYNYPDLVPRTETCLNTFVSEPGKLLSLREKLVKSQLHQVDSSCAVTEHDDCSDFDMAEPAHADCNVVSTSAPPSGEQFENMQEVQSGPISETLFLLAILFGTCILLYFFPPGP